MDHWQVLIHALCRTRTLLLYSDKKHTLSSAWLLYLVSRCIWTLVVHTYVPKSITTTHTSNKLPRCHIHQSSPWPLPTLLGVAPFAGTMSRLYITSRKIVFCSKLPGALVLVAFGTGTKGALAPVQTARMSHDLSPGSNETFSLGWRYQPGLKGLP
jgi:H+/Cl- antiporter ClcA